MNVLFICRLNMMRSRTAETIYANDNRFHVKSAGLANTARIKLTTELILWADLIFVMEEEHEFEMREKFPNETRYREIIILDIPDNHYFMEPKLAEMIKELVEPYIKIALHTK